MTEPTEPNQHDDNGWLHRLIMLSDGVFAIAITLLAIELHPPENWDGTAAGLFSHTAGMLLSYAISFIVIGVYWAGHRRSFARFTRADGWLTVLNFVQLGLVVLVPPATALLYRGGPRSDAFLIYWVLVCLIAAASAALWGYAAFIGRLMPSGSSVALRVGVLLTQLLMGPVMCGLSFYAAQANAWWPFLVMPAIGIGVGVLLNRLKRAG
jgi:uncharacterized membrane protein